MFDHRCYKTKYLVQATDCEKFFLWKENQVLRTLYPNLYLDWQDDCMGKSQTVGTIGDNPVNVSFFWATLDGVLVCFYEDTSMIVDHAMIEQFVKENFPNAYDEHKRWRQCNAMNFHLCRNFIKDRK